MSTLERAIQIAASKHAGKHDKGGEPYILHPLRVMLRLPTEQLRIIGVLHDVLEDTETTTAELRAEGFSAVTVEALEALTKRCGEEYGDFVRRAGTHPLARSVKAADIDDNLDPGRVARLPADVAARLVKKYTEARVILESTT